MKTKVIVTVELEVEHGKEMPVDEIKRIVSRNMEIKHETRNTN